MPKKLRVDVTDLKRESSSYLSPFCGKDGLWKAELEKCLREGEEIVLLVIGDVEYEVLAYLDNRKDIEIFKFIRLKGHTDPEERFHRCMGCLVGSYACQSEALQPQRPIEGS